MGVPRLQKPNNKRKQVDHPVRSRLSYHLQCQTQDADATPAAKRRKLENGTCLCDLVHTTLSILPHDVGKAKAMTSSASDGEKQVGTNVCCVLSRAHSRVIAYVEKIFCRQVKVLFQKVLDNVDIDSAVEAKSEASFAVYCSSMGETASKLIELIDTQYKDKKPPRSVCRAKQQLQSGLWYILAARAVRVSLSERLQRDIEKFTGAWRSAWTDAELDVASFDLAARDLKDNKDEDDSQDESGDADEEADGADDSDLEPEDDLDEKEPQHQQLGMSA